MNNLMPDNETLWRRINHMEERQIMIIKLLRLVWRLVFPLLPDDSPRREIEQRLIEARDFGNSLGLSEDN